MTEDVPGLGRPPVRHEEGRAAAAGLGGGRVARLFALVREADDDDGTPVREITAYGMALPDGRVMTTEASGTGVYFWQSPESASRRMDSELIWLA